MKRVLEGSRHLVLIGVISTLAASAGAFIWGAYKTVLLLINLVVTRGDDVGLTIELIALMDKFLIAAGLYIFAVGMYELFVDDLVLPAWLVTHGLHQMKSRLSSIIILVLAIVFLEHVIEWQNAQDILMIGIASALVTGALIAFNILGEKE